MKKLDVITRHWSIIGTLPQPGTGYTQNIHIGVEAFTMEAALETVRKIYPEIKHISCNHRGNIHARENLVPKQQ